MEEKNLTKVCITLLAWWNLLGGIPSLYFILKWWFTKDNHYSWKSRDTLMYCKVSSGGAVYIFYVFIPLSLNSDPNSLLVEGICWHFSYRCTSWLHWIAFCLNSRTLQGLALQGQCIIYSAFASLEGRFQSCDHPQSITLGQPIVADFS